MYKKPVAPAKKLLLMQTIRSKLNEDVENRLQFLVEIAEGFMMALEKA